MNSIGVHTVPVVPSIKILFPFDNVGGYFQLLIFVIRIRLFLVKCEQSGISSVPSEVRKLRDQGQNTKLQILEEMRTRDSSIIEVHRESGQLTRRTRGSRARSATNKIHDNQPIISRTSNPPTPRNRESAASRNNTSLLISPSKSSRPPKSRRHSRFPRS